MPPKTKFSREDIVNAAFELTREKGIEKITARDIAETGCMSTRPMFNYFYSIDKLRGAVLEIAKELFDEYIEDGLKYSVPFLGLCPNTFSLLRMNRCFIRRCSFQR